MIGSKASLKNKAAAKMGGGGGGGSGVADAISGLAQMFGGQDNSLQPAAMHGMALASPQPQADPNGAQFRPIAPRIGLFDRLYARQNPFAARMGMPQPQFMGRPLG